MMNNSLFPSHEEMIAEAAEAFRRRPKLTPQEHFTQMVRRGFINAKGEVTHLIGGSAEPEPDYENWAFPESNGQDEAKNARKR